MYAEHINLGHVGESAVANHLKRQGYVLRETNYRKKWGEIDLILEKEGRIHFVEVKTVTRGTNKSHVSYETWLPEENVDRRKLLKIFRTIESWLIEHEYDGEWQLDIAAVWLNPETKEGRVKMIEDIVEDL